MRMTTGESIALEIQFDLTVELLPRLIVQLLLFRLLWLCDLEGHPFDGFDIDRNNLPHSLLNTYALEHCDLSKGASEKSTRPFPNKYLSGEMETATCYRDCYSPLDVAHRLAVAGSLRTANINSPSHLVHHGIDRGM
ncbi:hypothetical protein Tco_0655313 [Tanacetum coccineum]|uniref:Uncharacterized protein n=1 Tax=Tanacetum coccineum TaxID=301880 RepID=A0ABQ4X5P1_9ASTR